jgi:hypothetical protein
MENQKRDYTFYLLPETSAKIDAHRCLEGKMTRSEFVDKAVNFYCGVLDADNDRAFLGDEIIKAMKAIVKDTEGRIFSHFRSQDISLSMLAVLFAANLSGMQKEEIESLRRDAVEYVDDNFRAKSFVTALTEQSEYEE